MGHCGSAPYTELHCHTEVVISMHGVDFEKDSVKKDRHIIAD